MTPEQQARLKKSMDLVSGEKTQEPPSQAPPPPAKIPEITKQPNLAKFLGLE